MGDLICQITPVIHEAAFRGLPPREVWLWHSPGSVTLKSTLANMLTCDVRLGISPLQRLRLQPLTTLFYRSGSTIFFSLPASRWGADHCRQNSQILLKMIGKTFFFYHIAGFRVWILQLDAFSFFDNSKIKLIANKYKNHLIKLYHKHNVTALWAKRSVRNKVTLFGLKMCHRRCCWHNVCIAQIEILITCVIGLTFLTDIDFGLK